MPRHARSRASVSPTGPQPTISTLVFKRPGTARIPRCGRSGVKVGSSSDLRVGLISTDPASPDVHLSYSGAVKRQASVAAVRLLVARLYHSGAAAVSSVMGGESDVPRPPS